jgi:transposase InsO family protein
MVVVYRLHGMPESIVLDRDRIFTSSLWHELFRLSGTQQLMSSSYHPQTNGQTERVNQCLETFLRSYVQFCPSKWSSWLSVVEFWYNTCSHSSLGLLHLRFFMDVHLVTLVFRWRILCNTLISVLGFHDVS